MKAQQALAPTESARMEKATGSPLFVEAGALIERMEELTKSVARRAYEFFEARGRQFGSELEDWFRAESELLRPIPVTMKEDESRITVQAEVPGFKAEEIKVSALPGQLLIEGSSEQITEEKSKEAPEKVVFSERQTNRFYRSMRLPAEIDPTQVAANLKDGVLEITLPKLPVRQASQIEIKTA
ncbi:MAG TPA: Hsp20 family protein [Blastocatellia bacterium]|nr:Hsp20 family protein [Blastocatellia bacterium]HMZ22469.1 Hsp20 family protein [Blastocatellia bacterium]HNG29912.1 Hsp20 family protein [Blastocatellia bacterium]